MPSIAKVKSTVCLFAGNRAGITRDPFVWLPNAAPTPLLPKEEVGKILAVTRASTLHIAGSNRSNRGRSPRPAEGDEPPPVLVWR